jgi:hypothetical protein
MYARENVEVVAGKFVTVMGPAQKVRVMARAEGYAMVRYPGRMPFVVSEKDLSGSEGEK